MEEIFVLESATIAIKVSARGAELCSLYQRKCKVEYLWQGSSWNKHSPVLFPIVGGLKNGSYSHEDQIYHLPRHGFARDRNFELIEQTDNSLRFLLRYDEDSLAVFPFQFELSIIYSVEGSQLTVKYEVVNLEPNKVMFFSLGAHPAFNVPLLSQLAYEDYSLQLDLVPQANKEIIKYSLTAEGLIDSQSASPVAALQTLYLNKALFAKDALVFAGIQSASIKLAAKENEAVLLFRYDGFPYLGIWAQYGADFVCIEPWQGIADRDDSDGELANKQGIIALYPHQSWTQSWSVLLS